MRFISRFVIALIAGLCFAALMPVRAQDATPPVTPPVTPGVPVPIVLFHDDFTTRADRWQLIDLGAKASINYDAAALRLTAKPANYAMWSIPDTSLMPAQFDLRAQAEWSSGSPDAQIGIVIDYHSINDMIVATIARDGQVRIGHYVFGVWTDLAPPVQLTLNIDHPIMIRAVVNADQILQLSVDDQPAQTLALSHFKAGTFGIFALSGASGQMNVSFQDFTVSTVASTSG